MSSPFRQAFRKMGGDLLAEPAGNEDLECGDRSSVPQFPTAIGYLPSQSRVYLPETKNILASTVPRTVTSTCEYFSHGQCNGQHGSTAQTTLTPSGPSKVIGYLPRTICNSLSSLDGPTTTPVMPSQPSQDASSGDRVSNNGPQCRSISISSIVSRTSAPPKPKIDLGKHGQALQRLETHGSLKTVPSCQHDGNATGRPSTSLSEFGWAFLVEDHSAGLRAFLHQQPVSPIETTDQEQGSDPPSSILHEKQYENVSIYQMERGKEHQSHTGNPDPDRTHQIDTLVQSPVFEEIDEYTWSPPPSDDGQEALPAPNTSAQLHTPSNALCASCPSGLASKPHGGFSWSVPHIDQPIDTQSGSSDSLNTINSTLPHIDVLIPVGNIDLDSYSDFTSSPQHASRMGNRKSSSILFRYSGVITDGASRPMSPMELKEEVRHSLGDREKTGSIILTSTVASSQANCNIISEQIREEQEPNALIAAFPFDQVQKSSTDAGPGSSQTSSSLSTDRYGGHLSGRKVMPGIPSSRARCPTPPLLFGKKAISEPAKSYTTSGPVLGDTIGSFDRVSRTTKLKETGRLPAALCSSGEQDWETVSAQTEAHTQAVDGIDFDTKTGSSLADNSDSGNLSLLQETLSPFRRFSARPILQHPAYPRCNYSFMLLKNSQTGDLVQVPRYEYASGVSLPKDKIGSLSALSIRAASSYKHPSPLRVKHNHPFTSSPPIISFAEVSATSDKDNCAAVQQDHLNSHSSGFRLSESVQDVKAKQTQHLLYKTTQDIVRFPDSAINQDRQETDIKEQSNHSSAWLSIVSDVTSSESSLPRKGDGLIKTTVWDEKGHVNSTPGRRGSPEVESSLADTSSPRANFSSSPALARSLIRVSDTPLSLVKTACKQIVQEDFILADFHKSLERSFKGKDSATSTLSTDHHSRSYSAFEPQLQHRHPSPHRRRSSSESHSRLMDSPSPQKASALNLSSSDSHAQQITSSTLLSRNPFLHSDENNSQYHPSQQNRIEKKGRQPKADGASIDDPSTPSSTYSRPFVRNGVVHTDAAPPILYNPVNGRDRYWDRNTPGPLRPRSHLDPLGHPLFARPVARAESPHLHRIPRLPTPELLERHALFSRVYLIPSILIPPIALIYGHGYMDGIMRLHTAGEINGFRNAEKTIALCWGYGLSAVCIFAIVIAMIIISASA